MPRLEKRFFEKSHPRAEYEIYSVGMDPDDWRMEVHYQRFWQGQLKETRRYDVKEFLGLSDVPKSALVEVLDHWRSTMGVQPAKDTI